MQLSIAKRGGKLCSARVETTLRLFMNLSHASTVYIYRRHIFKLFSKLFDYYH